MIRKALPLPNLCFNSTTVQLILPIDYIASRIAGFQFHNGTINTTKQTVLCRYYKRFNSTTVQLIRECLLTVIMFHKFQFHNGTINTLTNTQKKQLKMSELANNKYAFYMINYVDG